MRAITSKPSLHNRETYKIHKCALDPSAAIAATRTDKMLNFLLCFHTILDCWGIYNWIKLLLKFFNVCQSMLNPFNECLALFN